MEKLDHDYQSDSEEDESQNVTLEDLIAVTYGPNDSMTFSQQIKSFIKNDDSSNHASNQTIERLRRAD